MLTKSLQKLSDSEKILLAEDLWDSVAMNGIPVGLDEKEFIKQRLTDLRTRKYKVRSWDKIRAEFGFT